ncbi:group-specific protein [Paenibacillus polymyxa]|uniref:group-specific protein n=1 Tax=Paenibacillus polymyxa TaxID=1406 RepID=UPI00177E06A7|nr:group-specific protein [Paenibacillus polymyxa]QOH62380.1 group-specific protein [Paenibacillus polymyxa]
MIEISVDENEAKKFILKKISDLVEEVDAEYVFWDTKELKKRTCMSWNTIMGAFFYDPRFIKRKIGGKWYFPARETRAFLEQWILEQ